MHNAQSPRIEIVVRKTTKGACFPPERFGWVYLFAYEKCPPTWWCIASFWQKMTCQKNKIAGCGVGVVCTHTFSRFTHNITNMGAGYGK
jgi:hypothetical protein